MLLLVARLYDSVSGEFLWECNEHEGPAVRLWTTERSPGYCGIYGNSGMYILRGQKMADHATFMARGLFPVKTNADEVKGLQVNHVIVLHDNSLSLLASPDLQKHSELMK